MSTFDNPYRRYRKKIDMKINKRNTNKKTFFGGREGIGFNWVNIPNIEAKL
jgi:hypothetical protein